ncbi:MAG: hypothetical protein IJS16_05465 [Butyrivibrio sp.]|nr:hypothetical protein [Butyrivibrio sp.]
MNTAGEMSTKYKATVSMLRLLTDDELDAIQSVAKVFISVKKNDNPFSPKTEDELWASVEEGLKQADEGIYEDAETVEAEIMEELAI